MYPEQPNQQPQGYPPTPPPAPQPSAPSAYPEQPANPFLSQPNAPQPQQQWPQQPPVLQQQYPPQPPTLQQPLPPQPVYAHPGMEQPRSSTPEGVSPIDYLNQIAPKQRTALGLSSKQLAIILGVIMAGFITIAAFTLLKGNAPNVTKLGQELIAKTAALTPVVKSAQSKIKNNDLSSANSSLVLQLTDAENNLSTSFAGVGVDAKKIPKEITAAENTSELTEKLTDAELNAVFDKVYARELSYQLTTLLLQIKQVHDTTKNEALKKSLATSFSNINPLREKLESFSTSN